MKRADSTSAHHLFGHVARMFAAEALLVPVGVVTAAFLSRRFGPEGYGLLALSGVLVMWVEANVGVALSSPAIKLIGDAADWRPAGASVLRLYAVVGLALMLLLLATAAPLARLYGEPSLHGYLRLFALDVPLFCLAQAHRSILIGTGRFRERASATVARWTARLVLVFVFVEASGSLAGAIGGIICASLVELFVCRLYVRPRLWHSDAPPLRLWRGYALPLVVAALCMSLYSRLDLILLKTLGATRAEAGYYGVAQNIALLVALFSFTFAPALLSTLSSLVREGDEEGARRLCRESMRATLLLLPVAALIAGAAHDIVGLIFGAQFLPAATLVRTLIFGAFALLLLSLTTTMLTAAGRASWNLHIAWPLLLAAAAGHLLFIPRAGASAAAIVTTLLACVAATVAARLVSRLWRIALPLSTFARSAFVAVAVYALTALVPASGFWLFLKLAAGTVFVVVALAGLGEFSATEIGGAWGRLRRVHAPDGEPHGIEAQGIETSGGAS